MQAALEGLQNLVLLYARCATTMARIFPYSLVFAIGREDMYLDLYFDVDPRSVFFG